MFYVSLLVTTKKMPIENKKKKKKGIKDYHYKKNQLLQRKVARKEKRNKRITRQKTIF